MVIRSALTVLLFVMFSSITAWAEPALLTVSGAITQTNRGESNDFSDALLAKLEVAFDAAYEFTSDDLNAMPQTTITVRYPSWPSQITLTGPTLKEILDKVGAQGQKVIIRAVDGYAPEFNLSQIDTSTFVLATIAEDKSLGVGGRGPVWLVFPPNSYQGQPDDDSGLTWAAIHIEVK